jgi:U3 small nucleolar RNA-associated protein 22
MNHRYFYKRAYYLSVLASLIQDKKKGLKVKAEFSLFNGDVRRPILTLRPSGGMYNLHNVRMNKLG